MKSFPTWTAHFGGTPWIMEHSFVFSPVSLCGKRTRWRSMVEAFQKEAPESQCVVYCEEPSDARTVIRESIWSVVQMTEN